METEARRMCGTKSSPATPRTWEALKISQGGREDLGAEVTAALYQAHPCPLPRKCPSMAQNREVEWPPSPPHREQTEKEAGPGQMGNGTRTRGQDITVQVLILGLCAMPKGRPGTVRHLKKPGREGAGGFRSGSGRGHWREAGVVGSARFLPCPADSHSQRHRHGATRSHRLGRSQGPRRSEVSMPVCIGD